MKTLVHKLWNQLSIDEIISLWRTVRPSPEQNKAMMSQCEDGDECPTIELYHFAQIVYSNSLITKERLDNKKLMSLWNSIAVSLEQQTQMIDHDYDANTTSGCQMKPTYELRNFADLIYKEAKNNLAEKLCSCTDCKCKSKDSDFISIKIPKSICKECGINEDNISNIDIEITELADRVPQEVTGSKYPNGILISVKG
jgi:hypothetical protein